MSDSYPVTVIVRHPKERKRRCTVYPLKGREDMLVVTYPPRRPLSLEGYVRLDAEGPPLSMADAEAGLLLLDGSWRWAESMIRDFTHIPPRSLSGWYTAYPRASKLGTDPDNGLASVEALYIAYQLLGRPTEGLLDHYLWGEEFLVLNGLRTETVLTDRNSS